MSSRDVIRLIEALPANEQHEVFAFVDAKKQAMAEEKHEAMSVDDAIDHVFKNYDGLLAKLAK